MPKRVLTFRMVPQLRTSLRRGVGFLEGDDQLDAGAVFDQLPDKLDSLLRSRMDQWIDGKDGPAHYFHGFPNDPEHKNCFVFKWIEKRVGHRLYGFLCNPQPRTNSPFRLCVLNIHTTKTEFETDKTELDRVEQWRTNNGAKEAISQLYPEYLEGYYKWKH